MDFSNNLIKPKNTVKEALIRLNILGEKLTLFVLDEAECLIGTLTDGDIRRGLLAGKAIDDTVDGFMNHQFRSLKQGKYKVEDLEVLKKRKIKNVPLLDDGGRIIRLVDFNETRSLLPIDVVIMAGGKGERLKPLTDFTPKPLLKVGDKPIIEHNIDRLISYGIDNICISIRYLGEQLIEYFTKTSVKDISITFIQEDEPLGTIGAITKAEKLLHDYILVMNSDLLTNIDFEDFFINFLKENSALSIASIPYQVQIPYAVLETNKEKVVSFKEKPDYTYYSNAGIYLIKRELLNYIPKESYYDATDFMDKLISKGYNVTHYPILGYWLDIGRYEDYKKAQEDIRHLKL